MSRPPASATVSDYQEPIRSLSHVPFNSGIIAVVEVNRCALADSL
jgi:hypothetical protein